MTAVLYCSPQVLSCRLLDQAAQCRTHHVFKVDGGEAGAAELQLSDKALEEDTSLLPVSGRRPPRQLEAANRIVQTCCQGLVGAMDVNRNRGKGAWAFQNIDRQCQARMESGRRRQQPGWSSIYHQLCAIRPRLFVLYDPGERGMGGRHRLD
jgi:hypothetical protein